MINSDPDCTVKKLLNISQALVNICVWLLAVLDEAEEKFEKQAEWGD